MVSQETWEGGRTLGPTAGFGGSHTAMSGCDPSCLSAGVNSCAQLGWGQLVTKKFDCKTEIRRLLRRTILLHQKPDSMLLPAPFRSADIDCWENTQKNSKLSPPHPARTTPLTGHLDVASADTSIAAGTSPSTPVSAMGCGPVQSGSRRHCRAPGTPWASAPQGLSGGKKSEIF